MTELVEAWSQNEVIVDEMRVFELRKGAATDEDVDKITRVEAEEDGAVADVDDSLWLLCAVATSKAVASKSSNDRVRGEVIMVVQKTIRKKRV